MDMAKKMMSSSGGGRTIEYVGGGSDTYESGNYLAVSLSGIDVQAGDLIIYVASYGSHTTYTYPSISGYVNLGMIYSSSSDRNANTTSGYRVATGSETTVTFGSGIGGAMVVKVFRGVDTTNPLDVSRTTATGGSSVRPNPPNNTPVSRGTMLVAIAGAYCTGTWSSPDLDGMTSTWYTAFYPSMAGMAYKQLDGISAYNPEAWTSSISATADTNWGSATMLLRPAQG